MARSLLSFMFPGKRPIRLQLMPKKEIVEHMYLFALDAQYRDLGDEAAVLQDWRMAVAPLMRPDVITYPKPQMLVARYLKGMFEEKDVVWSLPREVFDLAVAESTRRATNGS